MNFLGYEEPDFTELLFDVDFFALEDLAEPEDLAALALLESFEPSSVRLRRRPDFLKSVSYQPDPLSRNPAADTSFLSAGSSQEGQSRSGSSLIFCITSWRYPQASHSYSYMGILTTLFEDH